MCKENKINKDAHSKWMPILTLFFKECYAFWKREDKNIIEALKYSLMDFDRITSNPLTPAFDPIDKEVKAEFCKYYQAIADDLQKLVDNGTYDEGNIRVCSICGLPMHEGYYLNGEYACDKYCCLDSYNGNEELMKEELSHSKEDCCETYYTEWESVLFEE